VVLTKPGAQIQKQRYAADRRTSGQRAAGDAACAGLVQLQKCGFGRVSAAFVWSCAPRFDARSVSVPWFTLGFSEHWEEKF